MLSYHQAHDQLSPEEKEKYHQSFRVKLRRRANEQWRIKWFSNVMKFYSHLHNFNIDNAVPYFHKMKELSYEGIEVNETLCDNDTDYGVDSFNEDGTIWSTEKQHAYKEVCDTIMREIKDAEDNMENCKDFVVAMEVIQAKKNMISRKKKIGNTKRYIPQLTQHTSNKFFHSTSIFVKNWNGILTTSRQQSQSNMAAIEQEYETTRMAELIEKRQKIIDEHNVLGCFDVLYHLQEHVNCAETK